MAVDMFLKLSGEARVAQGRHFSRHQSHQSDATIRKRRKSSRRCRGAGEKDHSFASGDRPRPVARRSRRFGLVAANHLLRPQATSLAESS